MPAWNFRIEHPSIETEVICMHAGKIWTAMNNANNRAMMIVGKSMGVPGYVLWEMRLVRNSDRLEGLKVTLIGRVGKKDPEKKAAEKKAEPEEPPGPVEGFVPIFG